jgi:hypothetical protein
MLLRAGSPLRSPPAAPITPENTHLYQRLIERFDGDEDNWTGDAL